MNVNCYAFRSVNECKILSNNNNCGKYCSFRKTEEEWRADKEKSLSMLAALPNEMQLYIAGKYYHDKRPWINNQENENEYEQTKRIAENPAFLWR